ncbi:MAG TPA: right-handed parallel beta-helix repeat-containing protein, partial [Fibrobacteria bacterium]|nr:right-handed parallel beta-helix repeat-containing protein [Fibrobacteria bacterium]
SVRYVNFENLTFTHTYRSLFDSTGQSYEKITGSDWGIRRKGAVFMQNAENILVRNCLFDQIGGNGVFMSGYNRNNVVRNSVFKQIGASGVLLMGLRSSIRCPNSWNTAGNTLQGSTSNCSDQTPGPLTEEYPAYCAVKNNLMDTLGIFEKQPAGVVLSATRRDTISHNTIAHLPRSGINFCDGAWGGTVVDYNWVYDDVRETSDHGPINAWGRDRNMIFGGESNVAASKYDAVEPTIVRMNRLEAPAGMFGIDLDDQASNYFQEKNLLISGGNKLQWNRYNTYINNIIIRGGNVQFHGVWANSNHYGARNVIHGSKTCLYQKLSGNTPTTIKNAVPMWDSNIVYSTAGAVTVTDWSQTSSCGGGTVYTWANWQTAGLDAHSSATNPMFADTLKTWPGRTPAYLPVGDFNPTSSAATTLKFEPFAMDSFGVIGTTPGLVTGIKAGRGAHDVQRGNGATMRYSAGRLAVACAGDYRVSIVSMATGRTLAEMRGHGNADFALDSKRAGSGLYYAVVRTADGLDSRPFIFSKL